MVCSVEIEEEEMCAGQTDEGYEVEEFDELSNVLIGATEFMQEDFADSKNISPEIKRVEMVCSVEVEEEEMCAGKTDEELDELSNVLIRATEVMQEDFADSKNISPEIKS